MLRSLVPPSCRPPDGSALLCFQETPPSCFKSIKDDLQRYMKSLNIRRMNGTRKAKTRFERGNVVGGGDPTGCIPINHVFLTRTDGMCKLVPSEVYLTRYPYTEGKYSIAAKLASWQDMPKQAFLFLDGLDFGTAAFPAF